MTISTRLTPFLAIILFPWSAFAEPSYISVHGGMILQDDYVVESEDQFNNSIFSVTNISTETGFRGGLAYGVYLDSTRLEFEFSHRNLGVDTAVLSNGNGDANIGGGGSVSSNSLMVNFYANTPLGMSGSSVYSFLAGVGGGIAILDVDDVETSNTLSNKRLSDSSAVAALQLMLGISMLNPKDEFGLSLEYRLFITEDADLTDSGGDAIVADGFGNGEILFSIRFFTN